VAAEFLFDGSVGCGCDLARKTFVCRVASSFDPASVGWNERLFDILIELVKVYIRQEWAQHSPLRGATQRGIRTLSIHIPGFEERANKLEKSSIVDIFAENGK
jgi:hypothetical protein